MNRRSMNHSGCVTKVFAFALVTRMLGPNIFVIFTGSRRTERGIRLTCFAAGGRLLAEVLRREKGRRAEASATTKHVSIAAAATLKNMVGLRESAFEGFA